MNKKEIKRIFDKLNISSLEKYRGYIHCPFNFIYSNDDLLGYSAEKVLAIAQSNCIDCRSLYNMGYLSACPCTLHSPYTIKKTFWDYISIYKTLI